MRNSKKSLQKLVLSLLLFLVPLSPALSQEKYYKITEQQMIELEQTLENYKTLEQNYITITKDLKDSYQKLEKTTNRKIVTNCIVVGGITFSVGITAGLVIGCLCCK